ncbi:MAG TPA: ROK family protein [Bryobacteraceae bacterium]|nr:ROK family protein [Bryobacteraceae bacterium]
MHILGIEIDGAQVKTGKVDEDGRILSCRVLKTPASLDALVTALHYIVAMGDVPSAIGIACNGVIDSRTTRVQALPGPLHYLEGESLADLLRPALRREVPIHADGHTRAVMAGEAQWGAARGCSNALMLTLGTDVGGAIIAGGRLLHGDAGMAGSFGHITVDPSGAPCTCGSRGCLETMVSSGAIEAEAFAAVRRGCGSLLTDWFHPKPKEITCLAVFEAAAGGDHLAGSIVGRAAGALSSAIATLLLVFDSEVVILGGPLAVAGAAFFEPVRAKVHSLTAPMLGREVRIVPRQVRDNPGIVGAAALVLRAVE